MILLVEPGSKTSDRARLPRSAAGAAPGSDGSNELSHLLLEVIDEMHLLQPSSSLQLFRKTPDTVLEHALRVVGKGYGFPSLFNADVVVEEFRPGVAKRLGIDYPMLSARNPRLVYCAVTGFGQTGPYRDFKATDIVLFALGGPMYVADCKAALARFGERGVIDLIGACGYYTVVSMVLNATRHPLPEGVAPPLLPLRDSRR